MARFEKRENGTYRAVIYVGRDSNGKMIRRSVTRATLKECKAAAREIEQDLHDGNLIDVGNVRFGKWMDKWLEINRSRLAPSTYLSYEIYVEKHYKPFFKNKKVSQVNQVHLSEYMSIKLEKYSTSYVRKHMLVLGEILDSALPGKNPMRHIDIPQPKKFRPHIITAEEFAKIQESVAGTTDEIIILLSAWCGLRRGEIFALKWNDIDWNAGTIRIDESRSLSSDGYIDKGPKSENGYRTITAPLILMDLLEKYRSQQKTITLRLFNIRPDWYSTKFRNMMDSLGFENIRFHDLRHYHASWLYAQGIPDHYAAERLGHDINVLKGVYQHLGLQEKLNLDDKIKDIK